MAFLWAFLTVIGRYPYHHVRMTVEGKKIDTKTPLVFVGNNIYKFDGLKMGTRERLDEGTLSLYIMHDVGRLALLWMMIRALFGALASAEKFEALTATEIEIATSRSHVKVATDGEVNEMPPPLCYRIRPGELKVMMPASRPEDDADTEQETSSTFEEQPIAG